MKFVRCDNCHAEVDVTENTWALPPKSWLTLKEEQGEKHFCGARCIAGYCNAREAEIAIERG